MQERQGASGCLEKLFGGFIVALIFGLILYWAEPDFRQMVHDLRKQPHKTRKIGEILDNFTHYAGEIVTIEGVANPVLFTEKAYLVSDESADILVISDYTAPPAETVVRVTGRVTRNRLGDRVIAEEKRVVVREADTPSDNRAASDSNW